MGQYVSSLYSERVERLALGIEPHDHLRRALAAHPVRMEIEREAVPEPASPRKSYRRFTGPTTVSPPISRHNSGRFALLYRPGLSESINVRVYDRWRRFVPRRLRVPLLNSAIADELPAEQRVRRPVLFPGMAYDISDRATGIRGRALWDETTPARWVRVRARLPGTDQIVGFAHGDDRGEFLLLVSPEAAPLPELQNPFELELDILAPGAPPVASKDWLWGLPLEELPAPGATDDISKGDVSPPGYSLNITVVRSFQLSHLLSGDDVPAFMLT